MKIPTKHSLLLLLLFLARYAAAQISFTTKAPATVMVGEPFRIQYTVNTDDVSDFSGPAFTHFECLNGPATSSFNNYQVVNGKASSSSSTTFTYVLSATKKGKYTLPGAAVVVKGRTYRSRPATVQVTEGSGSPASGPRHPADEENVQIQKAGTRVTNRDIFLTVTANKRKVYEQEPIVLTYKFHARVGVGLSNIMLKKKPDLNGFLAQEVPLPSNLAPTTATHNGVLYKEGTNLQYVIFPQKTGKLKIPALSFDCEVVQQDMSVDLIDAFFNGGGHISLRVQRSTPELEIEVLPLPTPKPSNFSGGVGKLAIKGELLTPHPATNEISTYRIVLAGAGNMKLIKAPTVVFPKDFETYAPKTTEETKLTADGIAGKVVYDYTFAPRNQGKYTIPAVEFTYFDSESNGYKTIRTQPQAIEVVKGKRTAADLDHELQLRSSDIRPPKAGNDGRGVADMLFSQGSLSYFAAYLAVLLVFSVSYMALRKYLRSIADTHMRRYKKAGRQAIRKLKEARSLLESGQDAAFFSAISKAVTGYAADKHALALSDQTKENIAKVLREKNVPEPTVQQVESLLEACEYAKFAPASEIDKRALHEQALQVIEKLEGKADRP